MKPISFCVAFLLTPLAVNLSLPAQAQRPIPRFTPSQIQQITGGLYPYNSQNFFRLGQAQLENEIKTLNERRQLLTEGILRIDQNVLKQPDFSEFERPPETSPTLGK